MSKGVSIKNGDRICENRKARYHYEIVERHECGISLFGSEVKSLRFGRGNIAESYAVGEGGEMWLLNATIEPYAGSSNFNHDPRRRRRLLLHRREVARLSGSVERRGFTLVPLSLYFNDRGRVKLNLGLCRGKQAHDKRQAMKERDWNRDKQRVLRTGGR